MKFPCSHSPVAVITIEDQMKIGTQRHKTQREIFIILPEEAFCVQEKQHVCFIVTYLDRQRNGERRMKGGRKGGKGGERRKTIIIMIFEYNVGLSCKLFEDTVLFLNIPDSSHCFHCFVLQS